MTDHEVGRYWDGNAAAWTELSRAGYDVYRDAMNTPAFLAMLPDIGGLHGLDVGCGEGTNTRQVRERCASMVGIDISPTFVGHAQDHAKQVEHLHFQVASAQAIPFADETFDFATAFMSLMDLPDQAKALAEVRRVLKPGGFFQFSITHPCTDTPHRRNLRGEDGKTYAIEIGRYYDRIDGRIDRWIFGSAPAELKAGYKPFEVPRFNRTLSEWLNLIIDAGLRIERLAEPCVSEQLANEQPYLQDTRVAPYFLHVRCRKD
jgi:SAM-dependent methyltransferase